MPSVDSDDTTVIVGSLTVLGLVFTMMMAVGAASEPAEYNVTLTSETPQQYRFQDLSAGAQNLTRDALASESNRVTVNTSEYPEDLPDPPGYGRYDADEKEFAVRDGGEMYVGSVTRAEYDRVTVTVVNRTEAARLEYANLSSKAQRIVDQADANGGTLSVYSDPPPEFQGGVSGILTNVFILRYEGDYYTLLISDADFLSFAFTGLYTFMMIAFGLLTSVGVVWVSKPRIGVEGAGVAGFATVVVPALLGLVLLVRPELNALTWYRLQEAAGLLAITAVLAILVVLGTLSWEANRKQEG